MLLGINGGDKMDELEELEISLLEKIKFIGHFITKIILYVVFILLLIIFLLFGAYFLDSIYNIKNQDTSYPLFNAYIIVSPSMVPTIKVQDGIIIKRESHLENGDIITFSSRDPRYTGLIITHRIVGIEKTENGKTLYRTKGDNNNVSDNSLVHKEDIYGKVLFRIPKIGYLKNYLSTPSTWIFIVVCLSVILVVYDMLKMFIKMNNDHKKHKKKIIEIDDDII